MVDYNLARAGNFSDVMFIIDPIVTPEIFAQTIVEDYALPSNYHSVITKSIQEQLSDYQAHVLEFDGTNEKNTIVGAGKLEEADERWWKDISEGRGRKRRKVIKDEDRASASNPIKLSEDSMRVLVKVCLLDRKEVSAKDAFTARHHRWNYEA